jgi:hypothetical protein
MLKAEIRDRNGDIEGSSSSIKHDTDPEQKTGTRFRKCCSDLGKVEITDLALGKVGLIYKSNMHSNI